MAELPVSNGRAGCLRVAFATVALAIVAPAAAVVRWWRARRRGETVILDVLRIDSAPDRAGLRLEIDAPQPLEMEFRTALTDWVVRVAEALRQPDDVYHVVYREPSEPEPVLLGIGPSVQALAERFHLTLAHGLLSRCTQVWVVLPRGRRLTELVDPLGYDPEAAGEPDGLLRRCGDRWVMAAVSRRTEAGGCRWVARLEAPGLQLESVERLLDGLRGRFQSIRRQSAE